MFAYDSNHQRLELGVALYEGGEGVIHPVKTQPSRLAKLYKPEKRSGKEAKLAWMVANPPVDLDRSSGHSALAWPENLLYDSRGHFAGYLMPYISNAKNLLHVINPRLRAQTLPAFDQRYLLRAARNLASALVAVHAKDYVIGDLNETNVLVTPRAKVTLIDVDSFQVKEMHEGQITFYPCPVGRPEYTPPELQGRSFVYEVRQPEQDTFALAVLIFQLLMEGSHPFRSVWLGLGDPPPMEEKIIRGWYPHSPRPRGPVASPPGLSLNRLNPALAVLMQRCFEAGHDNPRLRPSASDWESALKEVEKTLTPLIPSQTPFIPPPAPLTPPPAPSTPSSAPSTPATVTCPACGTPNAALRVYCLKCTAHLYPLAPCPHCGQPTAQGPQAKFCEACGRRL